MITFFKIWNCGRKLGVDYENLFAKHFEVVHGSN